MMLQRRKSKRLALLALCAVATSCDHDRVIGEGELVERRLDVPTFTGIEVSGGIDVEARKGPSTAVVFAQSNIGEMLETEVVNGIWKIDTRKSYSTDKRVLIRLSSDRLGTIRINGSGDVVIIDPLDEDELEITIRGSGSLTGTAEADHIMAHVQGSGDIRLGGSCRQLEARVDGSGDVDMRGSQVVEAIAELRGSGDISVHVTGRLDANIQGSGDIRYSGDPEVLEKVSGSGKVTRIP